MQSLYSGSSSDGTFHLSSRPFPVMMTSIGAANTAVFRDPGFQTHIQTLIHTFEAFQPWTVLPATASCSVPPASVDVEDAMEKEGGRPFVDALSC